MWEASAEHSPMTGIDEFLVHNSPQPVRVMWTSDPRAYERLWFTSQDKIGELYVVCGLGFYPNLGTAEAYAIVNHCGRHTTVRAHRRLGDDRMDMRVGPIGFEVVEPFKEWRLTLDDNDFGIGFDIRWRDTKRAVFHRIAPGHITDGRVGGETAGYETFGVQEGTVRVGTDDFALTPDAYLGSRDHHWGVRDGVGGRGHSMGSGHAMSGQWVEFADWSVWLNRILYNLGDPRPGAGTIVGRTHRLRFEPGTHLLVAGEVDLHLPSGDTKTMHFERLGNQVAYLRCGMYGGPNGGTPDGDVWQGMFVGDGVVSGETYDTNDPEVRARICGLDDVHARFECHGEVAYGIIEPYNTICYEHCRDRVMGFSLLD